MAQSNKLGLGPIRGRSLSEEATWLRWSTLSLITGNKEKRFKEEFLLGHWEFGANACSNRWSTAPKHVTKQETQNI